MILRIENLTKLDLKLKGLALDEDKQGYKEEMYTPAIK
jgi:hypothetical protein